MGKAVWREMKKQYWENTTKDAYPSNNYRTHCGGQKNGCLCKKLLLNWGGLYTEERGWNRLVGGLVARNMELVDQEFCPAVLWLQYIAGCGIYTAAARDTKRWSGSTWDQDEE